jgi:hypothetical protein
MLGSTKVSALSQGEIGWERSAASGAPKLEFEVAEAADSRSDEPAGRAGSPRGLPRTRQRVARRERLA